MADTKKIKMLVIPSDRSGVGSWRSVWPHVYIQEHYSDEFDIDIVYDLPHENLADYLKQYDLIHFHKQLDKNCKILELIKFLGIPVIMDIDDYWYLGDYHPASLSAKRERWHEPIIKHLEMADYVSTTTDIFAKKIYKHNKNVFVFPNAVNTNDKMFAPIKNPSDKLRVGIICGSSHLHDIEPLRGLMNRVADNVQLVLCGFDTNGTITIYNRDTGERTQRPIEPKESVWYTYERLLTDDYKGLSKEHVDFLMKFIKGMDDPFVNEKYRRMWTRNITDYATHYQNVDVLLAPLKECDFNEPKSELKFIEAGFTKTAIIAQNFGPYKICSVPMIEKGGVINENGNCLLVDSRKNHKDWVKYINKLAENPDMVEKLKENLYETVKDRYSIDTVAAARVEAYKSIVNIS